jgi:hypothetical protein
MYIMSVIPYKLSTTYDMNTVSKMDRYKINMSEDMISVMREKARNGLSL